MSCLLHAGIWFAQYTATPPPLLISLFFKKGFWKPVKVNNSSGTELFSQVSESDKTLILCSVAISCSSAIFSSDLLARRLLTLLWKNIKLLINVGPGFVSISPHSRRMRKRIPITFRFEQLSIHFIMILNTRVQKVTQHVWLLYSGINNRNVRLCKQTDWYLPIAALYWFMSHPNIYDIILV